MTEYETTSLAASHIGLGIAAGNMLAAFVAAWGIWHFGSAMNRANTQRAEADQRRAQAERDRHTESMTALKELIRRTASPPADPAE